VPVPVPAPPPLKPASDWPEYECNDEPATPQYVKPRKPVPPRTTLPPDGKDDFLDISNYGLGSGTKGGIALMCLSVIWYLVGMLFGILFPYPLILFVIGLAAYLRSAARGDTGDEQDHDRSRGRR